MYFSCIEQLNSDSTIYFGSKDGQHYLAEVQKNQVPTMTVLAKIDSAGTKTDVWQIIVDTTVNPKTVSVIHIRADQSTNTNHIIVAATSTGLGVGCGVKMSTTSTALWVYGSPSDNNVGDTYQSAVACPTTAGYDTSTVAGNWYEFCFDPSTLASTSSSACTSLTGSNFPLSSFSYAQLTSTSYADTAYTMITSPSVPSGLADFKTEDKASV
jgi:hypothetical protein